MPGCSEPSISEEFWRRRPGDRFAQVDVGIASGPRQNLDQCIDVDVPGSEGTASTELRNYNQNILWAVYQARTRESTCRSVASSA